MNGSIYNSFIIMASNQQHWELIKMQSMDDTDTTEFSLLDLEPKPELDLMEIVTKVSEGADSARVELGRSAEGGPTDDGDGGTGNALGGAGSIPMSYGSSPNGGSLLSATSSTSMYDTQMLSDQKPQIRHDCMWAGMCADQSHPEKHSGGGCGGCARQHHLLQHQPQQQSSPGNPSPNLALTVVRHLHKTVQGGEQQSADVVTSTAKSGPPTSSSSVLANRAAASSNAFLPYSRAKYTSSQASLLAPFKASQGAARIPAGSSLLIKRQQQLSSGMVSQSCRQLPPSPPSSSSESGASSGEGASKASEQNLRLVRVPHTPRGSFLAALEQEARSIAAQNHARPDTPLSLDDDPLEFKHNLDLVATCTIGSNQQSLLHTASSLPSSASCSSSSSCSSSTSSSPVSSTTVSSASTAAIAAGVDSRSLYGRLGGYCSCSGNNTSSSISSIGHTAQCYYNYLQDTSSVDDIRNKQLREQLLMLDDPCAVLPNHHHHHHPHYHQPYSGQHLPHPLRTYSPDAELEQLLIDLREIDESSSCLLDDQQHTNSSVSHSASMKDGSPLSSLSTSSVHHEQHHQQQQQDQQYQQQQRSALSLAPCGGELSGGAHATCNKECYCSSLELPHHLASPSSERRRRHQFAHRRRSITGRGWMSDDDEDEEEDLLKQLEEEDDFYDKHFEQNGANVVAAGNTATCGYTNSSSWEDDEEEDEDEEEEEEDEEESGEEEENKDEQEEEIDEDEEEEEGDANEESMYGDGSSSRSRSRVRSFRHRYHNQYNHQRRVARSYRPYGSSGKSQKKQSTNNVLATGGVNTIIAGSGASLKSSMLGSKIGSTSCNSSSTTNGSLNNSVVTSAAQQQSTGGTGANSYQATHFGDHSYTRPKGGYNMNELGVQTPSDSDEEIDVVSVGDKNLPTNPTERDMRHMQSEVANKIRTASSRSAGNGSLPYGTGSSHHHHHYQRQHHLADGQRVHHLGGIYPTPAGSTTISGANTPLPTRSGGASVASSPPPACTTSTTGLLHTSSSTSSSSGTSRKRPVGGSSKRSSNASKRMRLAHSKRGGGGGAGGDGSNGVRCDTAAQALAEELDTVEKRNLHNNLERQRRIGLKNLFEELKRQIPQLRDKDRAPKVNILREAAALCTRLNQEAEQVNELRQQQMKLHERVRYLRASIYSQQRFDI